MGTVFNIQRFSVHDGPGIRTTVFMKGCPLRCQWCHNPEGLSEKPQLQFFCEKCVGCGACGSRRLLSDAERCPVGALKVCGVEMSEDELMVEVLRDKVFYGENGGITFSGGECLLQADFVASVLELAKAEGLNTAVDTCGYVTWENIEKTLKHCDLYLYDIKCFDTYMHKKYTGVDNALILENLRRLSEEGKEVWIRIPLIPDFNDNEKEITDIARYLSSFPSIKAVTLMPYHSLGVSKYQTLGLKCAYTPFGKTDESEIKRYGDILKAYGFILK